jgi:cytohesin
MKMSAKLVSTHRTPHPGELLRAVRRGQVQEIRRLVGAGTDPNFIRKGGSEDATPLHVAVASRQANGETVRCLLELGADPNILSPELGHPPLFLAAQVHAVEKMQLLREAGANVHFVSKNGYTAVVCAAYGPRDSMKQVFEILLAWGVSPDGLTEYGESAVRECSRRGRFGEVRFLLASGAKPEPLQWTPLHRAAAFGQLDDFNVGTATAAELEARDFCGRTPLLVDVAAGDLEGIRKLIRAGANPRATWRCQQNALHLAAQANQPEALRLLLSHGLEADWSNGMGGTPLRDAVAHDALPAATILLEAGANIHPDTGAEAVIHCAHTIAAFELLLRHGGDLNTVSCEGTWPLASAARSGDLEMTCYLLSKGARVDLTSTGEIALHAAARSDALPVIEALLDAGANPNTQDVDGWTPLFSLRSPEAAWLLLSRGADPAITDECGSTATDVLDDPTITELLRRR